MDEFTEYWCSWKLVILQRWGDQCCRYITERREVGFIQVHFGGGLFSPLSRLELLLISFCYWRGPSCFEFLKRKILLQVYCKELETETWLFSEQKRHKRIEPEVRFLLDSRLHLCNEMLFGNLLHALSCVEFRRYVHDCLDHHDFKRDFLETFQSCLISISRFLCYLAQSIYTLAL